MLRLSIARSLAVALMGLTLVLAAVAGLSVGSLYDARQDFEADLARTYAAEVSAANVLAAAVVQETVVRSPDAGRADRRRARQALQRAVRSARDAAGGDPRSQTLVTRIAQQAELARAGAPALGAGPRRRAREFRRVASALRAVRAAAGRLAARQAERRADAREVVSRRSRRATIAAAVAGGLALLAALVLVATLVARLRRPLSDLLVATRRLAEGDLRTRVAPSGPSELQELAAGFNAMAEDLDVARERVEAGRRRLAATIESLGDALVICDAAGRVIEVNPRAHELVPEIVPGRDLSQATEPLPDLAEALEAEVTAVHLGRTLSVTAARTGQEGRDGVVWTIRDVTERSRLERAKSDFVATASHELRSPLTSIKGFVELLAAGELSARQREFVDVILLSTNRLVDLVSDLLDVARVEAGQLEVHRRPISVGEAVHEVAELLRARVAAKRQDLTVELAPALPAALADAARVRQIVTNLLTNAHLYTPEAGRIAVRVGAHGPWVTITVSDDGPGMSIDEERRLFERFHRGGPAHATPGTGLGMSIVRSLVELHEGQIAVDSTPGEGTTITVRLPRAPAVVEARAAVRGRRVLVVEDDAEAARAIALHLAAYEVEVTIATSAEQAERLLRAERFDAVTLDILLQRTSGFRILQAVRGDPSSEPIPVVVVSALAGDETLAAEWSVSKPIDGDELTDALGSAILAGRARVLVVARAGLRARVGGMLEHRGIDHVWATSGAQAARLCEEHRFEVALVDAGMRSPQSALAQLDLRGRRLRRSVVVFATDDDAPGLARLEPDPIPMDAAILSVVEVLQNGMASSTPTPDTP